VTTRTANGQKVTRPPLRRGPSSTNRLAVAAANNNAASKMQPLTRSKTAESGVMSLESSKNSSDKIDSPESATIKTPCEPPFVSAIYCSRHCAHADASRSSDVARKISYDMYSPSGLTLCTTGLPVTDAKHPYAPPSPLFISGSDTSSNPDAPQSAGPACSAPNAIEFFRLSREGPDEAWQDVQRQRRSSMHPNMRPGAEMTRQSSQQSAVPSGPSSDSLSSLWADQDLYLARSTSGSGKIRMTPMTEREANGAGRRSMSSGSDRSPAPIPTRPLPRSNLSQVSLGASPGEPLPAELGSAPNHTLNLWNSYHSAFPVRDSCGTSASSHKGFIFPGACSPISNTATPLESRRPSMSNLHRPVSGTIRAKSRTDVTWDSFGRDEVLSKQQHRRDSSVKPRSDIVDHTPKQSIEVDGHGWQIKYHVALPASSGMVHRDNTIRSRSRASADNHSVHSGTSDDEPHHHHSHNHHSQQHPGALAIPRPVAMSTSHSSTGRTPTRMLPPSSIPSRSSSTVPDLAALRIGSNTCAPYLSSDYATSSTSVPKEHAGSFNWSDFEKNGGKTYEVPKALKMNTTKAGLFFFPK
jgi:hypothetical protein